MFHFPIPSGFKKNVKIRTKRNYYNINTRNFEQSRSPNAKTPLAGYGAGSLEFYFGLLFQREFIRADGRTDRPDGQTGRRTDARTQADGRMNGRVGRQADRWMDRRPARRADGTRAG